MDLHLKDKAVLVMASSSGIGKAAAELFMNEGCKVAICSHNRENLLKASQELKSKFNVEPLWIVCDINEPQDIADTIHDVRKSFGDLDILVNNCGGPVPGFFEDLYDDSWQDAFEQVLMSAIRFTRHVLPGMKAKNWGRIINITSLSVKQPVDNLILSNSLRSAVTGFAKTLSNQVGRYNITVNNVAPGFTLTPRLHELAETRAKLANTTPEKILELMSNEVPMKRLAQPEEVASMIVYLASEQAGFINGQTIAVDGGVIKSTY